MGWIVNAIPRPLCPRERPGTHCIGGCVVPSPGLDGCGKSRPHRDSITGSSGPQRVAVPTAISRLALYHCYAYILKWDGKMVINILCITTGRKAIVPCFKLISVYSPEESDDNLHAWLKREQGTYILDSRLLMIHQPTALYFEYEITFSFKAPFSYTTLPFRKRTLSLKYFNKDRTH